MHKILLIFWACLLFSKEIHGECTQPDICLECKSLTECTKCISTHIPVAGLNPSASGNVECYPCTRFLGEGCRQCSSVSTCTKCVDSTFYMNATSYCVSCASLIADCFQCSSASVCISCKKGFRLESSDSKCYPCGQYCEECTKDICLTCKTDFYLVSPQDQHCSKCDSSQDNQLIIKSDVKKICSFYPSKNSTKISSIIKLSGLLILSIGNVCLEPTNTTFSSELRVAYVCGTVEKTLLPLSIAHITSKVSSKTFFSDPDYADSESKFFGYMKNNTVMCPVRPGRNISLVYYCINAENLTVMGKEEFLIPRLESTTAILNFAMSSPPSRERIKEIVCTVEDKLELKGKYLVKTQEGEGCNFTAAQNFTRILAESYELVILIGQDPFQLDLNTSASVLSTVRSSSFLDTLKSISGIIDSSLNINLINETVASYGEVPLPKTWLEYNWNTQLLNFTIQVNNTDSILWLGYIKATQNATTPVEYSKLKELSNISSILVKKYLSKSILIPNLERNGVYQFYYGAESVIYGNRTHVLQSTVVTNSNFKPLLMISRILGCMLICLMLTNL